MKALVKKVAGTLGYNITRTHGDTPEIRGYVGEELLAEAKKAGLTAWEYYDTQWRPACDFEDMVHVYLRPHLRRRICVVEIGTGVGRLAARILKQLDVATFFSFEPSVALCRYLLEQFPGRITNMRVTGHSLAGVDDDSADLVAAAGVFTYLPMSTVFNYLDEATRVLKNGGLLYFDILDTDGGDRRLFEAVKSYARKQDNRPLLSGQFVTRYLEDMGFAALMPIPPPGTSNGAYGSQFLLFKKQADKLRSSRTRST